MNRTLFLLPLISILQISSASADWRSDIGWNDLQDWADLNLISLPNEASVPVGIVEAGSSYMFNQGDSQLSDISNVINVSNTSSGISGHATNVARYFFGNTSSVTPDVNTVYSYSSNKFTNEIVSPGINSWPADVMSHAYVGSTTSGYTSSQTRKRTVPLDRSTQTDNVLHIVGVNNGNSTVLPPLFCHNYNNISVGLTNGKHSAGTVQSGYEGAGRQKPELVSPLTATSYSTGAVASVSTFLRAAANSHSSSNATLPLTLKSCILAGATKEKFSSWDNTSTRPIDERYGAGEVNIFNSFRILRTAEQSPGQVALRGWDHNSIGNGTKTYTVTVPAYASGATLCANLSWERGTSGSYYTTMQNLSLSLKNSAGTVLFTSNSAVDNLEHIWQTKLSPGNYTLTVDKSGSTSTDYVLAWRVDLQTDNSQPTVVSSGSTNSLVCSGLAPNHYYTLQSSNNLSTWTDVFSKKSSSNGEIVHNSSTQNVFYRLRYFAP